MAATQEQLYSGLDLDLSWSERELPERERTKHVHRLHPYLGKYVPQLVEALLGRYIRRGGRVLDPFAGSGTTLVQALESGHDAVGVDVAAFNCLLMRVKTARYDPFLLGKELRDAASRLGASGETPTGYVDEWFAPLAAAELLHFLAEAIRGPAAEFFAEFVELLFRPRASRSGLTDTFLLQRFRSTTYLVAGFIELPLLLGHALLVLRLIEPRLQLVGVLQNLPFLIL